MADIANQLQNDREAVLLLYLADELSPQERMELERMLTCEPSLRGDLERVRELQTEVVGVMQEWDAGKPLHISDEVSTRRVMREMRRLQLELTSRAPVQLEASSLRHWPKWIYPIAAVAATIVIVLGLWGVGLIDFQPSLAEQNRSQMPHYDTDEFPTYRDQIVQEHLQRILLASFGVEESDHPAELDETEDPAALRSNG